MLLAKQSRLSTLICHRWHKVTYHAGPRIMTALISREFWIVSIKSIIHTVTRICPVYVRFDAEPPQPIMAALPAARVQQSRSFARVGVDYAKPLQIREARLHESRAYKVYIAVFVSFSQGSVPGDSNRIVNWSILSCFRPIRRATRSVVGPFCRTAARISSVLINTYSCSSTTRTVNAQFSTHVHHTKGFNTLLTRIKAVLNSRPLTPLTTDQADLDYLSPGHFIVGQLLLAIPPRTTFKSCINLSQRWKLLDQCHQSFWRRWSTEYLISLQVRSKWTIETSNVNVNDMVVITDKQSHPLAWRLGRIIAVLPGQDGVVRVVRLLTHRGQITQLVAKIIVLPTQKSISTQSLLRRPLTEL